jgi:hypothetical protein
LNRLISFHDGQRVDNIVKPIVFAENKNELAFKDAVLAQAARQGLSEDDALDELHKLSIVLHDKIHPDSIQDFSDDFKSAWQLNCSSKSFVLFGDIRAGTNPIRINNWQDLLKQYYDCTV